MSPSQYILSSPTPPLPSSPHPQEGETLPGEAHATHLPVESANIDTPSPTGLESCDMASALERRRRQSLLITREESTMSLRGEIPRKAHFACNSPVDFAVEIADLSRSKLPTGSGACERLTASESTYTSSGAEPSSVTYFILGWTRLFTRDCYETSDERSEDAATASPQRCQSRSE